MRSIRSLSSLALVCALVTLGSGSGACGGDVSPPPEVAPPSPAAPPAATSAEGGIGRNDATARLLAMPLACVDRPWPNKPSHVYDDVIAFLPPEAVTPAFSGCFDWHSAVHGHWTLVRLLRLAPGVDGAERARAALGRRLSPANLARERAFFEEERSATFERPYGWGWLLRLQAELEAWDDPLGRELAANVRPLARQIAARLVDYLGRLSLPIRVGTHANTAYALAHALDYARVVHDDALAATIERRVRDFYGADVGCPTDYEPSGEDFLSPCLAEADLMRRVLPPAELVAWLDGFLPHPLSPRFRTLLTPPEIRDREDPRIGHLIGLCFHRAAAFRGLAGALPDGDARKTPFENLAARHLAAGLDLMAGSGYGGEHWLGTFAVFAMTGEDPLVPAPHSAKDKPSPTR